MAARLDAGRRSCEEFFEEYVDRKRSPKGCWLWRGPGDRKPNGYIVFESRGRRIYAHRLALWLDRRPVGEGQVGHHVCKNKRCVNWNHLVVLTKDDHQRIHGRTPRA